MFKVASRILLAGTFFAGGYVTMVRPWPTSFTMFDVERQKNLFKYGKRFNNDVVIQSIRQSKAFQAYAKDEGYKLITHSEILPEQMLTNHVSQGIMAGERHLEIDPIVFLDEEGGRIRVFYQLGSDLVGSDNKIHNGLIATLLDEQLCLCGFKKLPSGKGVTAQLTINFENKVDPGSTVVLKGQVMEAKGRKCIIKGNIETLSYNDRQEESTNIASAQCVLVEPKWFKYLSWLKVFDTV
ncbi:BA75_04479T0 [Komagataella pastoris]|uniref:BA75_04479T0 n=1 Tax=Komagataella pastoris TaxID=4922 RepID=A0A1B2JGZ5_PICPA|nr:BA75_04479T0 [Komagataella pastoris]